MNTREQVSFVRKTLVAELSGAPGYLRASLGRRASDAGVALREPPDSALGRASLDEARECLPPALLEHSLRCWYLGDLFGQLDDVHADPEQLYVSCLLHDLGLTVHHDPGATDFATYGAEVARRFVGAYDGDEADAAVVAAAIDRHMDMTAPRERPEAYLLHAAAQCDVVARRLAELPLDVTAQLVLRHPRDGFTDAFADAMRREARLRPGTRAAVLWRLGMSLKLRHNPLDR